MKITCRHLPTRAYRSYAPDEDEYVKKLQGRPQLTKTNQISWNYPYDDIIFLPSV